jgi:inosine/xanthosine triphosphatase
MAPALRYDVLMKKIVVASKNPVKLNATLTAFQKMFPKEEFSLEGVSVDSGVSDQPLSDDETYQGASNRAANAKTAVPDADFWVGLEGGVESKGTDMESFAWMVIESKIGLRGKGRTGTFFLPPAIADLIRQGKELGEADDIVFGQTNSKQATGALGLLTGDVVTRGDYYEMTMDFALIPFKNPDLYTKK